MNILTKFFRNLGSTKGPAASSRFTQHESRELFERVFSHSPIPIVLVALRDDHLLEANPAAIALFGFGDRSLLGQPLTALGLWADPADQTRYRALLQANGSITGFDTVLRSREGRAINILLSGSLVTIAGEPCSLNFLIDLTPRNQTDLALAQSEEKFHRVFDQSPVVIALMSVPAGRVIEMNAAGLAVFGYTRDEMVGRTAPELGLWVDLAERAAYLRTLTSEGKVNRMQVRMRRKNGEIITVVNSASLMHIGEEDWSLNTIQDVTEQQRAEQAVRASEEKFRGVFDKSPVIMGLLTVPEGRFVEVNAAGIAAFGYTREEALGRTSVELNIWADPADRERYLQLLRAQGSISAYETVMRRRNGEFFTVLYSGSLIRIADATYSLNSLQDVSAHRQAEASLVASERRYERVVQNIRDALIIDDGAGRIVFANGRFRQLFGLAEGDPGTIRLEDFVAPEWCAQVRDRHDRRIRGEPVPDQFDYEAVHRDGTRFWVEVDVAPVIENGVITGTQSLHRDITDRKLTEQAMLLLSTGTAALRGASFYQHIALEAARLFGADLGLVARCTATDPFRAQTLGLCLDGRQLPSMEIDLRQKPCAEVREGNCVIYPVGVAQLFSGHSMLTDHHMEGYAAAPLLSPTGKILGHVAIVSRRPLRHNRSLLESVLPMIAFKVAAEMERQQAESKFRDLFAFAPDAILIATQQGVITDANQRALEMFGYTHAELTSLAVDQLMPADCRPELLRRLNLYLASPALHPMGTSAPGLFALSKAGRRFPIDISLSPLQSDQGLLVAAAIRDISAQVRAAEQGQLIEAQLRQAQKMESLGTLAGGIAHDFNNILTGMFGFIELARLDLPADHAAREWLDNLATSSERARNLVGQILTFSRKDKGQRVPLDLPRVADEAMRLLRATIPAMVRIETDFTSDCPPVMADSNQLHQVLINLATNSWHAMPAKGGLIRVSLAPCELPAGSAAAQPLAPPGPYVRLTMEDNAAGMDAHTLERIFDPFFTTKKIGEGTGLGLAVVHGIVQAHAGFIKVRSSPGLGTTFDLYFPAMPRSALPESRGPVRDTPAPRGAGERILLVDDDTASGQTLARLLEWLGYRVTLQHSPVAALGLFRAAPMDFDLVISDLAMPGLNGFQLVQRIRAVNPGLPVLMISGFVSSEQRQELRTAGVNDILHKPPTLDDLTRAVSRCLHRPA